MQGFQVHVAMHGLTINFYVALKTLLYDLGPNPYMCARADLRVRWELVLASLFSVWHSVTLIYETSFGLTVGLIGCQ